MKSLIPARLAAANKRLQAQLVSTELPRFVGCVDKVASKAQVELEFRQHNLAVCHVLGHLQAEVWQACQRCLEPVRLKIETTLDMCIVPNDAAAKALPAGIDPFILDGQQVSLADLIEDALIMALPIAPKHDGCQLTYTIGDDEANLASAHQNPFAVLKNLK